MMRRVHVSRKLGITCKFLVDTYILGCVKVEILKLFTYLSYRSSADLYLNFEKSSWKNQVQRTGFLACKNQFQN